MQEQALQLGYSRREEVLCLVLGAASRILESFGFSPGVQGVSNQGFKFDRREDLDKACNN
jgi:hypothetical protein